MDWRSPQHIPIQVKGIRSCQFDIQRIFRFLKRQLKGVWRLSIHTHMVAIVAVSSTVSCAFFFQFMPRYIQQLYTSKTQLYLDPGIRNWSMYLHRIDGEINPSTSCKTPPARGVDATTLAPPTTTPPSSFPPIPNIPPEVERSTGIGSSPASVKIPPLQ